MAETFLRPIDVIKELPIKRGDVIADFGTGSGHFAVALSRKAGEASTIYAIDIMNRMVSKVKMEAQHAGLQNVYALKGDLERLGGSTLKEGAVHGVVILNVLFQAQSPQSIIQEAARITRLGGWCVIVDWNTSREVVDSFGPPKEQLVAKDDVLSWAKEAGFSLEREFGAGSNHFGILLRK